MNRHFKISLRLCFVVLCMMPFAEDIAAQQFVNSELDGSAFFFSALPTGWQNVTATDPVCLANTENLGDTPDVCNATLPDIDTGCGGQAFSGSTFVGGLIQNSFGTVYHEGIQQTVSGFTVGNNYSVDFYQTVVKQVFALDGSGSWLVYMDDVLLGTTAVTESPLIYDDPNLIWEFRSLAFVASSTVHTFKFLPTDDDNDINLSISNPLGSLRMGIDLITIETNCNLDLGPDILVCEGELSTQINADLPGTYLWSTGETTPSIEVEEAGLYTLTVVAACGTLTDEVLVSFPDLLVPIDLGADFFACEQDFPIVLDATTNGEYIWNTGEVTPTLIVNGPGTYSVTVFNGCEVFLDEIEIAEFEGQNPTNLGEDLLVCSDALPFSLDAGLANSYLWSSGETTQMIEINQPGEYSVTATNSCGSTSDNIVISIIDIPEAVSLGEDLFICQNDFPIVLETLETDNNILWSNGSTSEQILVNSAGLYTVDVFNQCGTSSSEVEVTAVPNDVFEESIVLCQGESETFLGTLFSDAGQYEIILPSDQQNECDVFWNINVAVIPTDTIYQTVFLSEGETFEFEGEFFDQNGTYFVLEEREGVCDRFVGLIIEEQAEVFVYVPSAFTPTNDGLNELFKPIITLVGDISLTSFEFGIYNRWGQKIFDTKDSATDGWNGGGSQNSNYYAQDGIYTWVLKYGTSDGAKGEELFGSVVVVR